MQIMDKEADFAAIVARVKSLYEVNKDSDLAAVLGVNRQTVYSWKTRNVIPLEKCMQIATDRQVSLDWILFGQNGTAVAAAAANDDDADYVSVPMYDVAASAGYGSFFSEEQIVDKLHYLGSWIRDEGLYPKDLAVITIAGESMSPTLNTGDAVLVNMAQKKGDGVFLLRVGDALRVKRLQWLLDGSIRVISDNPIYPQEVLQPEVFADESVEIIGLCHSRQGKLN
ncbi:MAG: helix-turn-helix domain-containing protein [Neisseriaceae bacterium]|nr:helix-turn-helix domain-containing protein [Neisseriaceae bacterium]